VVVVDWNYGAANIDYFRVVRNTRITATNLTAFIRTMEVWQGRAGGDHGGMIGQGWGGPWRYDRAGLWGPWRCAMVRAGLGGPWRWGLVQIP